ncbi:MAG TPA: TIM barrel protein [Bryobacteraceae bacterium]|nr:TIM barrel protein [Bryobacteraceae bacterium]
MNHQHFSRREFLPLAAAAALQCQSLPAAPQGMKLSLSVRVAESFENKEKANLTIDQLLVLAKKYGYEAICMRASQCGVQSTPDLVRSMKRKLDHASLPVSMVTGDFAVPNNNEHGPDGLRKIKPYLDLTEAFGSDLIRVCMKTKEDIVWAQRAADEARERKIRLAHQSHCASLFETVDGSVQTLTAVNRPNFGLIYEPANWMISGQDYGKAAIRKVKPWIFNVYIQNHRLNPAGKASVMTWSKGKVPLDHIGVWEKGGVNSEEMFAELHAIGYNGFVTVHQAFADVMPVEEAVKRSAGYLRPLLHG